jgi:hypothetical protein
MRIESDSPAFLEVTRQFLERYQDGRSGKAEFLWRVLCTPDPRVQSTEVPFAAFSDPGISYVNIGQRSFLAVDLEKREGIAFIAERFLEDDPRFKHHLVFDTLFSMSLASLRLTGLAAACVGLEERGVLIFGPPNSGKTTASYLAAKLGMEFHADQAVCLDLDGGSLRAWGDPFPAAFRPQTLNFVPELRDLTCSHSYAEFTFCYLSKRPYQAPLAHPVVPVGSIFLDRARLDKPEFNPIGYNELPMRFRDSMVFQEDGQFDTQITAALSALSQVPAYELKYGPDPRSAVAYIRELLTSG